MTITNAYQVWPEEKWLENTDRLRELEQMLDRGDACLRGLPYRVEFSHLIETKTGRIYLVTAGK